MNLNALAIAVNLLLSGGPKDESRRGPTSFGWFRFARRREESGETGVLART